MEVKPGYKQTEVGVIPEDWDIEPLGTRASFKTGPFGSALHQSDYVDGGIPVINPMHINDGRITPSAAMSVSEDASRRLIDFRMKPGEIIIGRRGDMGRCAVVDEGRAGWMCGTGSMLIRPRIDHPEFLQRILSNPVTIKAIEDASVGSTMINLNQATLSRLNIQIPPVEEQRAIATALSDMDALLDGLDRLIAKKRAIKQATMQQLLTGQTRLPGFSGEWEVKRLGEIAELNRQNIVPASQPSESFAHFSLPAFDEGQNAPIETGDAIGSNKFRVPSNAVLVSKLNPRIPRIWAPSVIPSNAVASTEWLVLTPKDGTERAYLFVLCSSPDFCQQMELSATGTTGSHQRISPSTALNIRVVVPNDLGEQTAIATILSDMDAEITALETRRTKTCALKLAMMQELLTGRTRLV